MIWIELFPLLVKTFTTSSALWGKFKDMIRKDKTTKYAVCAIIVLFVLCELAHFFINHNKSCDVISGYEAGYSYNLQDLNAAITKLVEDYKNDTLYQSAFTSVSFAAVIGGISLIFRDKNHIKNRLKYVLSGIILMVYICGVIIPMSFTSTKLCTFSVEPTYRIENNPTYIIQGDKIYGVKNNQELAVTYEWEIELSERKEFDGFKMFLLSVEITAALALLFVIKRTSNQNAITSTCSTYPEDDNNTKP